MRRIEDVCARHAVPLNVVAVQFPLALPAITSVVVGTGSAARITATLQALQTPIPAGLWADLRAEGLLHEAAPVPQ